MSYLLIGAGVLALAAGAVFGVGIAQVVLSFRNPDYSDFWDDELEDFT
jgi:hypothetical protein